MLTPRLTSEAARAAAPVSMPDDEWQVRVDLAALYRLVALRGWDDLIFTHISARVPGSDHHFLINPLGSTFDEITASSLIKIDLDGNVLSGGGARINRAGFVIHSAIHAARDDARFIVHLHTDDGMAVAAHREGLLPTGQMALSILPLLAYHDYEGIALDLGERERLVRDLGSAKAMLLRNHGTLALGATPGEAWLGIYYLERACTVQVRALSMGRDMVEPAPQDARDAIVDLLKQDNSSAYAQVWTSMLRKLHRDAPGFDS